jgi:hypothetical protein
MPFPEFESDKKKILFFSRGRGRGHAIPDAEIVRSLTAFREDIDVRIASYGAGAATFEQLGMPLIDLGLPEAGSIVEMSVLAGKLIGWLNPDLVVSHEEFAALPAAKIFDRRTVFLTDWLIEQEYYSMAALKFADQILFLGPRGIFDEPPWVSDKIRYLGPLLRQFRFAAGDRDRARAELGISLEAWVLSVFPGSWREANTPILDPVIEAFDALDYPEKILVWLAGADCEHVKARLAGRSDSRVLEYDWQIDRLMVASNAAITKTNRKAVFELQYLQVATVAISFELNPADDRAAAALPNVSRVRGKGLNGDFLAAEIRTLLARPLEQCPLSFCSAQDCAKLLCDALTN